MHYPKYFTPIKNPLYLSIHNSLSPSLANTIKIRDSSCQTVLPPGVISSRHDKEGDNRSSVKVLSSETSRQTQANFFPPPSTPFPSTRTERYQRLGIVGMHQAVGNFPSTRATRRRQLFSSSIQPRLTSPPPAVDRRHGFHGWMDRD